jgi:Caudovirus prohead serine protease
LEGLIVVCQAGAFQGRNQDSWSDLVGLQASFIEELLRPLTQFHGLPEPPPPDAVAEQPPSSAAVGSPVTREMNSRTEGSFRSWPPALPLGENVREAVRRGDIDGASFRFVVDRDSWEGDLRTVEAVKELKDVTVATFGAYPAASVELRTRSDNEGPREGQEDTMEDQEQQQVEQHDDESRALAAGSLRVENRAEVPRVESLAEMFESRGFPTSPASVTWDEFRTLTWSAGTVLTDLNPVRREGVALGYDQRWAYPAFPSTGVDSATTAVQILRQQSRTLAAGTAVVRPLDSVTTKPEVDTVTELVSQSLSQVAAVSSNVPNIYGEQVAFLSMVETDLRLSISDGYDRLVLNGLATAGTLTAGTAGDVIQKVRRGMSQLATAGYAGDTLIIDAAGAENLDLLRSSGSEAFYLWAPGQSAGPLFGLNRRVTKAAGTAVVDSEAFGGCTPRRCRCRGSRSMPASPTDPTIGSRDTRRSGSRG